MYLTYSWEHVEHEYFCELQKKDCYLFIFFKNTHICLCTHDANPLQDHNLTTIEVIFVQP